ncbi:NADH-quinone oxidoreductase subunit C [Pasteuria penetrans]|uniref:NADH-quinone oxidoreductase subunit C n=1 Tax=Pasteuria penetrans TaxID=86005 RepID=UPI000FADEDBE|nr:NADH-quinone oxidoreductase subunit C [Pasteuria penetrans]
MNEEKDSGTQSRRHGDGSDASSSEGSPTLESEMEATTRRGGGSEEDKKVDDPPESEGNDSDSKVKVKADPKIAPEGVIGTEAKSKDVPNRARPTSRGSARAQPDPPPIDPEWQERAESWRDAVNRAMGDMVAPEVIVLPHISLPVLSIVPLAWREVALFFRQNHEYSFSYMRNYAAADQGAHFDVILQLASLIQPYDICLKASLLRGEPSIPSLATDWEAANWNEREMYDLLGIHFEGHPDLRRIMLPDGWVGHPLRKDYEPFDEGV